MAHSAKLIWIASTMFLSPATHVSIFFFDECVLRQEAPEKS
jgi:hypothetical protein